MAEQSNSLPNISALIDTISKNPAIIESAKNLFSSLPDMPIPGKTDSTEEKVDTEKSDAPKEDAPAVKLPENIQNLLPSLLSNAKKSSSSYNNRCALLQALRPYLSSSRCAAIDKMISLGQIGDLLGGFDIKP